MSSDLLYISCYSCAVYLVGLGYATSAALLRLCVGLLVASGLLRRVPFSAFALSVSGLDTCVILLSHSRSFSCDLLLFVLQFRRLRRLSVV